VSPFRLLFLLPLSHPAVSRSQFHSVFLFLILPPCLSPFFFAAFLRFLSFLFDYSSISRRPHLQVIQQTLGQQVSQPVAQIVAGFAKVFVGEIIEKGPFFNFFSFVLSQLHLIARAVQTRRGDTGPLSPDHLREAYRSYQEETGRVGAARPVRAKRLFVR
jgi:transcription initiation factor TFIID subunit 11